MIFKRRKRLIQRILIVEDEPLIAFELETYLLDADYHVVGTVDGVDDALEHLASGDVHLLVTDMRLAGGGSGLDVAAAARAQGIPVLLATATAPADGHLHALGCLTKPFAARDLLRAIEIVEALKDGRHIDDLPDALLLYRTYEDE